VVPRQGRLIAFFLIAYGLMWACFISVAIAVPPASPMGGFLLLLGTYAPTIAALLLTWRDDGAPGVRALVGRIFKGGIAPKYIVIAVSYIAVIKLTAAVIHRAIFGAWPLFGAEPLVLLPFAILLSTPVQAGEEIGWRGYALPRLTERFGLAAASVILGLIWAFWHLPQFFIASADTYHQAFIPWAIQVVGLSVVMAWLYARTRGNLLIVMLMHAAANNTKDIVPSALAGATNTFALTASPILWLTAILMSIVAASLLTRMRGRRID
jgi:membrane protease YdiL (CAAX protease family)